MAWAIFSASEASVFSVPSSLYTLTSLMSSSSPNLISKLAPLLPPYLKFSVPDTVLTCMSVLETSNCPPSIVEISPVLSPPRPDTV